jgi:thiosulfate/3-mercaptopyruvate sulfurtransferase
MIATLACAALAAASMSSYVHPEQLVDTAWVAAHSTDPGVRIVDMRRGGFETGHVPGAVWLDPVAIRDARNPPTFLPSKAVFEKMMASLGISDQTRVVSYDDRGGLYAARLWWILHYFGHENAALMDGGWNKWSAEHRPAPADAAHVESGHFTARPHPDWLATASDVVAAIDTPGIAIVDARTQAEIDGEDLRGIRRGGFVPSSIPVYWEDLIDPQLKTFLPADRLKQIYESRGVVPAKQVIVYCQVGMRASVDIFALRLIGYDHVRNYYGAWEEWGNRDDLPLGKK